MVSKYVIFQFRAGVEGRGFDHQADVERLFSYQEVGFKNVYQFYILLNKFRKNHLRYNLFLFKKAFVSDKFP